MVSFGDGTVGLRHAIDMNGEEIQVCLITSILFRRVPAAGWGVTYHLLEQVCTGWTGSHSYPHFLRQLLGLVR